MPQKTVAKKHRKIGKAYRKGAKLKRLRREHRRVLKANRNRSRRHGS